MERGHRLKFLSNASVYVFVVSFLHSTRSFALLRGVSPEDETCFRSAVIIQCKDGSKSFSRDRLNDGFCDCVDGTDEPGTSACPESKFYCRNIGSSPQILFSSRVNDHICDCCDGSDEYDGSIDCPNTCVMDQNFVEMKYHHETNVECANVLQKRSNWEDLVWRLKELKMIVTIEVVLLVCLVLFAVLRKRPRSRRRWLRRRNLSEPGNFNDLEVTWKDH